MRFRYPPSRPNVVVIFTDDQQFRAMGCTGNQAVRTPHLDRLAAWMDHVNDGHARPPAD